MELTEAIAAVNNSEIEGKEEILEAINTRLQETSGLETQVQSLENNLDSILGITGVNEGNLTQKLEKAQETIKGLQTTETNYQQELAERDKTIAQMKQETTISEASRLTKANGHVLKTLLSQGGEEIILNDGKPYIKTGDKQIELEAYAKEKWGDFVPSLFPNESSGDAGVSLPGGNSSGEQLKENNVVDTFIQQKYSGVDELFNQAS